VPVTHEQIAEAAEALDESVILLEQRSLPAELRGTPAGRVLTEVGLPRWLGSTVSFHPVPKLLDSTAEPTLVAVGTANLYDLCVDPATGEVVAYDWRRGRRPLNTNLPAFVDMLYLMMTELDRLTMVDPGPGASRSAARRRLAVALRQSDPGVADLAVSEWWLIFDDLSSELIGPDEPDADAVAVDLSWSDGTDSIDVTLYRDDVAGAEALRRRFGQFVTLLERISPGVGRRAAIEALHNCGGAVRPHPAVLMMLDPTPMNDAIERRSTIAVSAFLGWSELLPMLNALRSSDRVAEVRADAALAYQLVAGDNAASAATTNVAGFAGPRAPIKEK